MAKKKKQDREYSELQKLTRNESRNLDQLPAWKQKEIKRLRANEARIAEEQDEKDRRRGRGAYHPDVLAAQAQSAAQKQQMDSSMSAVAASMMDSIESSSDPQNFFKPPAVIPGNRGPEYKPIPEQYASNFWEDDSFIEVAKAIQTGGAKKASTYIPTTIDTSKLKTPEHPSQVPVVVNPFTNANLGGVASKDGKKYNNYESMMAARTASAKSGIKSAVQGLLGSTGPKTSIKPPAYLMTLYGPEGPGSNPMPFFEGEVSTYESIKETTKDSPNWWVREALPMLFSGFKLGEHEVGLGGLIDAMYQGADININGQTIRGVTIGGMVEEEWTYQEDPNGPQAAVQALFNLGVYGIEALRYSLAGGSAISPENIQNPDTMNQAKREQAEKMGEAWDAFMRSWETGKDAYAEWIDRDIAESSYATRYLPLEVRNQLEMDKKLRTRMAQAAALEESERLSSMASEIVLRATENLDPGPEQAVEFKKAIQLEMQSIEAQRASDPMDAWGAATWQREPERYQYFIENAAILQIQLGRPLTVVEIRRLKDMYTNVNTELAFQLVFDLTNIIPAVSQVTQVSSAFPIIGRIKSVVTGGISKVTDYIPVVRWLKKPAIATVATQIADNMDNLTRKMIPAYRTTPELIKALNVMEPLISDFKLVKTLDEQAMVFEKAKKLIPGVQEWDINDFKRFSDSYNPGVSSLAEEFSTAQKQVQQAVFDTIKKQNPEWSQARIERYATKRAQSPEYVELTTRMFGTRMAEAFRASHRIFENSSLYDDTLIGQIVKKFALLTANVPGAVRKPVNPNVIYRAADAMQDTTWRRLIVEALEHPKSPFRGQQASKLADWIKDIRTLDDWLIQMGVGLTGNGSEFLRMSLVDGLEHVVRLGNIMRQAWVGLVLTTPRWLVTNLIDSMGRGFIYGENIFDDLSTLVFSTQRHFGGNSPIAIPREMTTSLARTEVGMLDEVSIRLMYEDPDNLPGMNIFSFIKREHGRRYGIAREAAVNPSMVGISEEMRRKYIQRVGKNAANPISKAWDWIKVIPGSIQGAAADFNTSIEFTLRSRMFYRSYMTSFADLEARAIAQLIDETEDYSPFMKELMTRIYKDSEGSPSKMKGLVNSLLTQSNKDTRDLNQMYTWLLPAEWMAKSEMEPERLQLFTHTVRENVEKFMDTTFKKTGDIPTTEQWDDFFNKFQKNMEDSYQEVMSVRGKEFKTSEMDDTIDPRKNVQKSPNHKDLKGPNPVNLEQQRAALDLIRRKGGKGKFNPEVIQESYKTVMTDIAEVVDSVGNKVTVTISNGKPKITFGSEFWDQPREQIYVGLRDATLDVIAIRNAEYLGSLDISKNQFRQVAVEFMDDAAAVLAKDEKAFVIMMDEMDENPILRDLLAATNKNGMDKYEGAVSIYRNILDSKYSAELYGAEQKDIKRIMQKLADDVLAPSVERRKSATLQKAAAVRVSQLAELSQDSGYKSMVDSFMQQRQFTRDELKEFGRVTWPGPGVQKTGGETRGSLWDVWENMMAKAYSVEAEMFAEIEDVTRKQGYEAGRKYMEEMMANFNEEYLKRVGFEVIWTDDTKSAIFQIKNRFGGSFTTFSDGSNAFDHIKQRFFGDKARKYNTLALTTDGTTPLKRAITSKVRVATGVTYKQAEAWTSMMETHAKRWMDITGGTLEEYFNRFTLQVGGEVPYLARTADGGYRFITDTSGDLPTFLKQTSEILFNDMQEMAKYDDKLAQELATIAQTIEDSTLRKSILLKYIDLDETQRVGMREFMLGKMGEQRFNEAWNGMAKVLEGKRMGPELMNDLGKFQAKYQLDEEDMLRLLNSSYPTIKKADIKRYVEALNINRTMDAAEYNAVFSELFMEYLQTGWAPPGMPKAFNRFKEWLATDFEVLKRLDFDMTDDVHDALTSIFIERATAPTSTDEMLELAKDIAREMGLDPEKIIADARAAKKAARTAKPAAEATQEATAYVPPELPKFPDNFADYTTDDLERLAAMTVGEGRTALPAESLSRELDEVWKVYIKSRKNLRQFPAEAITSPWAFRKYAKEMADSLPPAAAEAYLRSIADVDTLIRQVARIPAPFPDVKDFQLNSGLRTFLRASDEIQGDFEEMKRALESMRKHLTTGGMKVPVLDDLSKQQLLQWLPEAMSTKAKTVNVATYGGEFGGRDYNGAIKRVNDIMLDYTDQNRFDTLMKGMFPFWMFPSRSIPFWMKTAATHPELIAFYNKMKRYSEANRMQAGAVTSDGRPIDSQDGYMPIPGTDIWINPLAPLSFRYVLAIPEMIEELTRSAGYDTQQEELDPMAWSIRKVMEIGPMVGFNMAPWTAFALKQSLGLPDSVIPKFPAAPFVSLIPRFFVYDMIQKADKIAFGDFKLGQFIYPEADFNEANTERRIYQNALEQMQEPGANKALIIENVKRAIMERQGNALWDETYKELTNQQALQSIGSYFTGFYAKPFSDSQAELYALRNELNILKSSMNNEFQASVFQLDGDAQARWTRYLETQDLEESQLYRLYVQSGWVRDEAGNLVTNPQERAKYLKEAILAEQKQQAYYAGLEAARKQLDKTLKALPIGASYEVISKEYQKYYDNLNKLRESNEFAYDRSFGTWKPTELIQGEVRDEFYYVLLSTRPRFDENMSYDEYQRRMAAWEQTLPMLAPDMMRSFTQRSDIAAVLASLKEDQKFDTSFWTALNKESQSIEGIRQWQLEKDDLFDALNNAWSELYWRPYWENAQGLDTTERDLYDYDFAQNNPPPTAEQMYSYIRQTYGTRFSIDDVRKWVNGTETLNIEKRLIQQRTQEQTLRSKIWDYMSWLGPSKDREMIQYLEKAINDAIGDDPTIKGDILSDMMERNNSLFRGDPQSLQKLVNLIEQVYKDKRVKEPTREQMVQYVKAQDSNEQFKKLINQEYIDLSPDMDKTGVTPYDIIQDFQSEYFAVENSKSYSYKYKKTNPEEYAILQEYWTRKRQYGRTDKVWNMYYNMSEDKQNIPTQFTGIFGLDDAAGVDFMYQGGLPNTSGSLYGQPQQRGVPSYNPRQKREDVPEISLPNEGGVSTQIPISIGLKRAMGNVLSWEVNSLIAVGRPLTQAAIDFFTRLRERHPEWSEEIDEILKLNGPKKKPLISKKKSNTILR